jgi:predicted DNA-binding antitoxin AbrB/MazE fold protein
LGQNWTNTFLHAARCPFRPPGLSSHSRALPLVAGPLVWRPHAACSEQLRTHVETSPDGQLLRDKAAFGKGQNRQVFNLQRQNIDGGSMLVKAIYENSVLRPLERLDLKDGDLVEIEVKKNPVDQLYGIIKVQNKQWLDEIIESPDLEPI